MVFAAVVSVDVIVMLSLVLTSVVDLHEYLGGPNLCPTTPHPITGETVPLTFGHEFSGTIEEVGEGVTDYKPGDRVAVQPIIYDDTCGACESGLHNCCWSNGFVGLSGAQTVPKLSAIS